MAEDKKFRVWAKVTSYCYMDVMAQNSDEAEQKVEDQLQNETVDGGDFVTDDNGGGFDLVPDDLPTKEVED